MTDEARLQRWIDARRDDGVEFAGAHIDIDTLTRHAGSRLSPADARLVQDHLDVCEDGRCPEFVRAHHANPDGESDWIQTSEAQSLDAHSARTFRSREIVWATFESMARELALPIDDLVNDAMVTYAEARGYSFKDPTGGEQDDLARTAGRTPLARGTGARPPSAPPSREVSPPHARPPLSRPATPARPLPPPPSRVGPPPLSRPAPPPLSRPGPPPLSRVAAPAPLPPPSRPSASSSRGAPPEPRSARAADARAPSRAPAEPPAFPAPPPRPPHTQRMPESPRPSTPSKAPASTRQLVLEYEGKSYPVEKDRFLIGRSKTQADLRLDDPNVSRQHAVIERVGAAWYIVDLGSTNGISIAGERVARRALTDADVITITTHKIHCTLR